MFLKRFRYVASRCVSQYNTGKTVCFTAVQPTGSFHIGNFFGSLQPFLDLIGVDPKLSSYFCIADLHALSEPVSSKERRQNTLNLAAALLASGVDPKKTVIFKQSDVPAHTTLALILGNFVTIPHLQRMGQFKEKSSRHKGNAVPLGILTYPVLQAADILLYRADIVPVGPDQIQHIQIAQFLQKIFASKYATDFLPYPSCLPEQKMTRIMSLRDPYKKMSKSDISEKTRIEITDDLDSIRNKIRKALTDFHSHVSFEPENRPAVSNLVYLHSLVTNKAVDVLVAAAGDLILPQYKEILAEDMANFWGPITEQYKKLVNDEKYLCEVLDDGRQRASVVAEKNIDEIMRIIGLSLSSDIYEIPERGNIAQIPRTTV